MTALVTERRVKFARYAGAIDTLIQLIERGKEDRNVGCRKREERKNEESHRDERE